MIRSYGLMLLSIFCTAAGLAYAADTSPAPFGLEWAMNAKAAEAIGIKLRPVKSEDETISFLAEGLPKVLGDIESVRLDFGYADKLRKIVAVSRSFTNDPFGNAVSVRYDELFQLLESKYGRGKTTHKMGDSIYAERRYFLSGLKGGRSWHYSNFEADGVGVELSIRAKDGDTGYWVLIYENKTMAKDVEKEKREREKKSL